MTLFDMNIGRLLSSAEHIEKLGALAQNSDLAAAKEALQGIAGIKIETEETVEISFE